MEAAREQRSAKEPATDAPVTQDGAGPTKKALAAQGDAALDRVKGPQAARAFPKNVLRPGNRFDGIDFAQWMKVISTPLPDGPNVVGPIPTKAGGIRLGNEYFFVVVANGGIAQWCPLDKVPLNGTRLDDYLVFRTPAYVEVQQDRVTDAKVIANHAPKLGSQDVKDRADTAAELNRDLEHFVATGSSISQAKAQVRGVHEDVLVEMVLGVTRIVQTMATTGGILDDAVECAEGLTQGIGGKLREHAANQPYAPKLRATEAQHTLASTPGLKHMPHTPDNHAGMSRMQDLHDDRHLSPGLRNDFIADTHARLARRETPTDSLHWEMSRVAYNDPEKYLRTGLRATVGEVHEMGGLWRVVSMKVVLASLINPTAYKRFANKLGGRIPKVQREFRWQDHADVLFEAYKNGELDFHLGDLDPNAELRGATEGSSAWTFSHADAGSATSSPAMLQKQLAVNAEYAAGYIMVEIAPETAVQYGAAKPTAIDLTNSPLGKLNSKLEPFGRTNPTHPDHKDVRELVLTPIPISKTTVLGHVR